MKIRMALNCVKWLLAAILQLPLILIRRDKDVSSPIAEEIFPFL